MIHSSLGRWASYFADGKLRPQPSGKLRGLWESGLEGRQAQDLPDARGHVFLGLSLPDQLLLPCALLPFIHLAVLSMAFPFDLPMPTSPCRPLPQAPPSFPPTHPAPPTLRVPCLLEHTGFTGQQCPVALTVL